MERIRTSVRQASFTRPANTTNYTAKDAMGAGSAAGDCIMEFPPALAAAGKTGKIISARLWKDDTGVTNDGFTIYLYQDTPAADPDDNAAPSTEFVAIADVGAYIGKVVFNTTGIVLAGGVFYEGDATIEPSGGIPFHSKDQHGRIFGILTAVAAYNPASAEVFTVTLEIQE